MKTYFLQFEIKPLPSNEKFDKIEGADAHFFVKALTPDEAADEVKDWFDERPWEVISQAQSAVEITEEHLRGKLEGIECYRRAQKLGLVVVIGGWLSDTRKPLSVH